MARILFSAFSNVWIKDLWDSHAEGFINALKRQGNDLLCVRTNQFVSNQLSFELNNRIDENKVKKTIQEFNPELIITYNNSLPGEAVLAVTSCPIIVYPADVPAFWCNKDSIADNLDRYYFFQTATQIEESVRQIFKDVRTDHFIQFGYATDMRSVDIPQDINISFVGSIGNYSEIFVRYFQELGKANGRPERKNDIKNSFFEAFDQFASNTMQDLDFDFPFVRQNVSANQVNPAGILNLTCRERFLVLSAMTDLGLKIYGWADSWAKVMEYNYELFRCYDYQPSVTLSDNTKTYSRSKISLNLPHGNAVDGFSWRVCDVLASNSVLLSVRKKDLVELMNPYCDIPVFESASEARTLAEKLLKDPIWRKEISLASQAMIEDCCRFEQRFKFIEQQLSGVTLSGSVSKVKYMNYEKYLRKGIASINALKENTYLFKLVQYLLPHAIYMRLQGEYQRKLR